MGESHVQLVSAITRTKEGAQRGFNQLNEKLGQLETMKDTSLEKKPHPEIVDQPMKDLGGSSGIAPPRQPLGVRAAGCNPDSDHDYSSKDEDDIETF